MFWIGGYLSFFVMSRNWDLKSTSQLQEFAMKGAFIIAYSTVGTTIALLVAVFAGFKGAQVFRDEIENGSFLIILSKPVNRITILFQKWLAFMTIFFVFIALLSSAHVLGCIAAQKGNYIGKYLFKAFLIEFSVSMIFLLIFSSIALIISTFFSSKGVMGIMFVIGMGIVFTQVISQFTYIAPYQTIGQVGNVTKGGRTAGDNSPSNFLYTRSKAITDDDVKNDIASPSKINNLMFDQNNLYAINPDSIQTYNHFWPFDLSYHINIMDSLVLSNTIGKNDPSFKSFNGQIGGTIQKQVFDGYQDPSQLNKQYFMQGRDYLIMENMINILNQLAQHDAGAKMFLNVYFAPLISQTNNWFNNTINNISTTDWNNSEGSFNVDVTDINNSDAPFSNSSGSKLLSTWKNLIQGTPTIASKLIKSDNSFTLESLFAKFGDPRFTAQINNPDQRDITDNNIFNLIMSFFQTQTLITTMHNLEDKIAVAANESVSPIDLSFYNYIYSGYQELTTVARTLGQTRADYSTDSSKMDWTSLDKKIIRVRYQDFANPYMIMSIYLSVGILLLPLTYFVLRRQDFN